ncbi:MAG: DUF2309 domain-containing protein [Paracoccaceae bacterium]|nr:DUF2309 domain-containing protein [Paracoccaceae bacterium]
MSEHWTVAAADNAIRAIPPAWSLEATVAVNPFLGQSDRPLAEAAALIARVAGARVFPDRVVWREKHDSGEITDDDLVDALMAAGAPVDLADLKKWMKRDPKEAAALPTVAELATKAACTDWATLVAERIGAFASAEFDEGQALWAQPKRATVWDTWRGWARRDLTPEIHGLTGFAALVAALPLDTQAALVELSDRLGVTEDAAPTLFHRLLMDLGGWSQFARHRLFEAEKSGGGDDTTLELLLIRMAFEVSLLERFADHIGETWAGVVEAHAAPVEAEGDDIIDAILQSAGERAGQRRLATALAEEQPDARSGRAAIQAAFCIDVRSEVFRRSLESVDSGVETLGFAGFFGLGVAHKGFASDVVEPRLPVLLSPGLTTTSEGGEADLEARYLTRAKRAWGRFKLAAVSSFAFVEASGPLYGAKLVTDSLGKGHKHDHGPAPRLDPALPVAERVAAAKTVLSAMSLTSDFAPLVILAGHGASVTNNPHQSALHCGACGGYAGDVNARLLAGLLNDAIVRNGLHEHDIHVPEDTLFLGALHDTTTDEVTLFDEDVPTAAHVERIEAAKRALTEAGKLARGERAARLPRAATGGGVVRRSADWSETRPEWALAGCSAFIAAPRGRTAGRDLRGRAFLHNYDWQEDEDFAVLELILTAPVVVASWISLQYYGSTVAPKVFGGGTKVLHNVVGGIGVLEGNGGRLMAGLPWQSVHDGERFAHEPLRLSVVVEAPRDAMNRILEKHPHVAELFDNGWLSLFAMDGRGRLAWRYRPDGEWDGVGEGWSPNTLPIAAE